MIYVLQPLGSTQYSLYCDELKFRTWADCDTMESSLKCLLDAGGGNNADTLQLAIEQSIFNNDQTPLVYSKADYPELFI